jgi:3-phenylpropionate/cinnamic acid dioxygenase small subunit
MNDAIAVAESNVAALPELGRRLRFGEPIYNEICDFLIEEAFLLDEDRLREWLALLAEDVLVTMPVRQTRYRKDGRGFSPSMTWMREDLTSLTWKVSRMLDTDSAFAEDPPSRVRRAVCNVRVHETTDPNEFLAQNCLLIRRARGDAAVADMLSFRRDDLLRRSGDVWKLARRTLFMDQSVLGTPNLSIFL